MSDTTAEPPRVDASADAPAGAGPDPRPVLSHKEILTILVGLMMGMFLAALDQTIVASAMRVIADDLNDLAGQAWVTTAYLITSTIATPLYGKLGDIYGRKKLFIFAITIFTIGSMLCTLAWSIPSLAAFRAVQGIGAGGLFSLALAIIGDIVPPRERAKYQGYFLAVFGTSSVLGPVIGGFFAGQETLLGVTGWRWVFLVNVPIAVAALIVVTRTLHLKHTRLDHRIDYWGAAQPLGRPRAAAHRRRAGPRVGLGLRRPSITCYAIGLAGLVAFFLFERAMGEEALHPAAPLHEPHRRRRRRSPRSSSAWACSAASPRSRSTCRSSRARRPTQAGLQLLPMTLGIMSGSIVSGQLISRTGRYRHFPIIGSAILVAVAVRLPLRRRGHPALEDDDRDVLLRHRPRLQLPAADPRRAERRRPPRHGRGDVVGDLHPPDRRHARHRRLPVDPVLAGRDEDLRGLREPSRRRRPSRRRCATRPAATPPRTRPSSSSCRPPSRVAARVRASAARPCRTARSSTSSTRALAKPFLVGFSDAMSVVFMVAAGVLVLAFIATLFLPNLDLGPKPGAAEAKDDEAVAIPATDRSAPPSRGHVRPLDNSRKATRRGVAFRHGTREVASRRFRRGRMPGGPLRMCCFRWVMTPPDAAPSSTPSRGRLEAAPLDGSVPAKSGL